MDDLKLDAQHAPPHVQVKAAGGIRDLDAALAVRAIGVTRFGCTRTVEVLEECQAAVGIAAVDAPRRHGERLAVAAWCMRVAR